MTTALSRLPGSSFELTVNVPWDTVKKIYDEVFNELASQIEIEGFRKGNAPKEMVAGKVDQNKVYGEVVNRILPDAYQKALEEHGLKPIISPQVRIASAEQEKDWQFLIKSAEKPTVEIGGYSDAVKGLNAKGKIWKPGDEPASAEASADKQEKISKLIEKLIETCKVELPEMMVESEVNRLMTQLVEDVRQAGLTFEQYLASSGQSSDQIKERYKAQAESALKLEFILEAVADDLKVEVSEAEVEAVINKETDEAKKKSLKDQSYIIASILRRENTINRLLAI